MVDEAILNGIVKLSGWEGMPGAGLIETLHSRALYGMLALKPYWKESTVRNSKENDGNVGVIRNLVVTASYPTGNSGSRPSQPGLLWRHLEKGYYFISL